MMTINVKAIIGSTSSTSHNLKVVEFMRKRYSEQLQITPVFINDLETFSIDIENEAPPAVQRFKEDVKDSDAVLFAVPEYNYSIPGALKNAIDWCSRGDLVLQGKPAFIIGASIGALGTVRAQLHLKEILTNPMLAPIILPGNDVFIGTVQNKLDAEGDMTDQATIDFLDKVVQNFVEFYKKNRAGA